MIMKADRGIYFVKVENGQVYPCKARGLFRKDELKPLVGDQVEIRVSNEDQSGYIEKIFSRSSELLRPPIANINQVVILMSIREPDINLRLLDKYLLMTEKANVATIIVFNKIDLIDEDERDFYKNIYDNIGYTIFFHSNMEDKKLDLIQLLDGKMTAVTGPSGAGKSTTLSTLFPDKEFEIGEISQKLKRGKNTTRHIEVKDYGRGKILDTPGFSSLSLNFIDEREEIPKLMREFNLYSINCKFHNCMHLNEPGCGVKGAVDRGEIHEKRYENYKSFIEEFDTIRRY